MLKVTRNTVCKMTPLPDLSDHLHRYFTETKAYHIYNFDFNRLTVIKYFKKLLEQKQMPISQHTWLFVLLVVLQPLLH